MSGLSLKFTDTMAQALQLLFEELDEANIRDLKLMNQIVLSRVYPKKFYKNILKNGFGHLAVNKQTKEVMGGYSCTYEKENECAYIATFGVYASWRRRGIGSILINQMEQKHCRQKGTNCIKLHCKSDDLCAVKFYEANGFKIEKRIKDYYANCSGDSSIAVELRKIMKF